MAPEGLIGRAEDLGALTAEITSDRAIVVVGEAGIGKTALVRAAASLGDRRLIEGGAFATLREIPYLPLRRAITRPLSGDATTVAGLLEHAVGPDLLFLDDLQWADEATLGVIPHLVGRLALVAAVRALDPGAAGALDVLRHAGAAVLQLGPLTPEAARAVVALRSPSLAPAVVDGIVRRAAGNPLLLEELAEHGQPPDLLIRVLASRLDEMAPAARSVIELLAVAGHPVRLPGDTAGVAEALAAGMAVALPDGLEIRHQLVADAVRDQLEPEATRHLHDRLAELTTGAAAARHLAEAGHLEAAVEAALREEARATDLRERAALLLIAAESSPVGTAASLRLDAARALDELAEWPAVRRILEPVPADQGAEHAVEAHALLAHAAFAMGEIGVAREHRRLMETASPIPAGSAAAIRRAIESATFLVNVDGAVEAALQVLEEIGPDAGAALADVDALRASILLLAAGQGSMESVQAAADAAFEAGRYRTATDRSRVIQYLLNMAVGSEAALAFLLESHARFEAAGLGTMARDFLADAVVTAALAGRPAESVTIADGLLEEPAAPRARQTAGIHRARALVLLGRIDEAAASLEALLPIVSPDFFGAGETLAGLAEAARWGGRPELAIERSQAALAVPVPIPVAWVHARLTLAWATFELERPIDPGPEADYSPSTRGAALELRALGAAQAGDLESAMAGFEAAAEAWSRFHAPRALESRWALGEMARRAGRPELAITTLRGTLAAAEAMGFEPLAARARRSLRLLGVRAPGATGRSAPAPGLTDRERELARLVELGLTNVEIARRLGLGRPTVAQILASAMAKLGVSSRAQIAAAGISSGP